MEERLEFDYFHECEAEQFSFYRIPKALFTDDYFKSLSCEAKILYGLMLDRMCLSMKNNWIDAEGRVYIIFTLEQVTEYMNCGRDKGIKILAELDTKKGIGLIERVKQGFGKPNAIYVKNFVVKSDRKEQRTAVSGEDLPKKELPAEKQETEPQKAICASWGDTIKEQNIEERSIKEQNIKEQNIKERNTNRQSIEEQTRCMESAEKTNQCADSDQAVYASENSDLQSRNTRPTVVGNPDVPKSEKPTYRGRKNRPREAGKTDLTQSEKPTGRGRESPLFVVVEADPNDTDRNNTDLSNTDLINQSACTRVDPAMDGMDQMDAITAYTNIIKKNIEYDCLVFDAKSDSDRMQIDMIVSLMAETIAVKRETVTIAKAEYPYPYVVNKLLRVNFSHVQYILWCLRNQTGKIWNIKAYVLACIFNAPTMIDAYYQAEVNHDMHGKYSG
ncbi:MAG: replication initiator protein A [Lachnospiraceae bacterium]|nr:replication initiator protein A [Lachnospiraceae bacterium]